MTFPGPNATREEINAWVDANTPSLRGPEPKHEVPPVENGPSPVCNACGVVRIPLGKVLCNGCNGVR